VRPEQLATVLRDFYEGRAAIAPVMRAYAPIAERAMQRMPATGTVVIGGTATTPTPDRYGDIVEPLGAQFDLPLSLLWQHFSHKPVGSVVAAKVGPNGIQFAAELPKPSKSAALIERFEEAVESMELGLVRATSIGFRPLRDGMEIIDQERWTFRFTKWEWLELSLVTIPANAEATIDNIKHYASAGLPANARNVTRLSAADKRKHHIKNNATYLK
jgi:Escherichia/Staphylococcus phage prohead protease